jgi:subtilisin family serine protease
MLGEDPDSDSNEPDDNAQPPRIGSHGTMVAVKAAGKRYGTAKKATIVPVKIVPGVYEIILGMNMAFQDIKRRERGRNSVIVMSLGIGKESEKTDRDKCLDDPVLATIMPIIQGLHELGVPIVFAAGNARTDKDGQVDRDIIDSFPQVMNSGFQNKGAHFPT